MIAFHARFEQHAIRTMRRYGWPDLRTKETAWRRFLDEECRDIKGLTRAEHGDLDWNVRDHVLVPTSCSPSMTVRGGPAS